jgi:3-hydroxyisobutyrate dehydrogenase-like beta-hydroxyacid dehydrogenase
MTLADVKIGFIGVGQMGMPMVRRIHLAGGDLTVWARRVETIDELRAAGVDVADDPCELAASVDVLEVCLFSDAQLDEVLIGGGVAAQTRPGSVVMSHVTGSPTMYATLAAAAGAHVSIVDAPISGTAAQIAAGELTVLLGGSHVDVERVTPILETFAAHIIHAGPLGDAQRVKLVNNLLFAANVRLAGEAIRIGAEIGISQDRLVRAMAVCSGNTRALGLLEMQPFAPFATGIRRFLDKDVSVIEAVAAELGIDLGPLGALAGTSPPAAFVIAEGGRQL